MGVAGDCTDIESELRLIDEVHQNGDDNGGDAKAHKIQHTDVGGRHLNGGDRQLEGIGPVLTGEDQVGRLLEHIGKAHGGDHQEHIGGAVAADTAIGKALAQKAHQRAAHHAADGGENKGHSHEAGQDDSDISADHGEFAVGPVREVQQTVDQGVACCQQRVDTANRNARHQLL